MPGSPVEALSEQLSPGGVVVMLQGSGEGHPRASVCSAHQGEARFVTAAAARSHSCTELRHCHPRVTCGDS